jgi:predicted RNase H-like HicB family nuclease
MRPREYDFTILFEPAEEGGYIVRCPALPGLVTEGNTLAEARAMALDAIRAYIESLRRDGLRIPEDRSRSSFYSALSHGDTWRPS